MPAGVLGPFLRLLGKRVPRPVVLLVADESGELVATERVLQIAMARCRRCKGRWRVLPADVLAHKHYGLAVIASLAGAHVDGNQPLRTAAWTTHTGQAPAHSTLHAWTEGLGAHVLGRPFGSQAGASTFSELSAKTTARWPGRLPTTLPRPTIDPQRHRTEARGERLAAVAGVLQVAAVVVAVVGHRSGTVALCAWRRLAITYGVIAPLAFRTGISSTPFERAVGSAGQSSGLPQPNRDPTCPTRIRSPSGDSNRSLPTSIPPSTRPAAEP